MNRPAIPKETALIKYNIDYQYMPKGPSRPRDDGEVVGVSATDEKGIVIVPNVGDYVHIAHAALSLGDARLCAPEAGRG